MTVYAASSAPAAAKRKPIDTGYFATFDRPTVSLADTRAASLRRISETAIVTTETECPVDAIVFVIRDRDGFVLSRPARARKQHHII
jgi:hypothetical protein